MFPASTMPLAHYGWRQPQAPWGGQQWRVPQKPTNQWRAPQQYPGRAPQFPWGQPQPGQGGQWGQHQPGQGGQWGQRHPEQGGQWGQPGQEFWSGGVNGGDTLGLGRAGRRRDGAPMCRCYDATTQWILGNISNSTLVCDDYQKVGNKKSKKIQKSSYDGTISL